MSSGQRVISLKWSYYNSVGWACTQDISKHNHSTTFCLKALVFTAANGSTKYSCRNRRSMRRQFCFLRVTGILSSKLTQNTIKHQGMGWKIHENHYGSRLVSPERRHFAEHPHGHLPHIVPSCHLQLNRSQPGCMEDGMELFVDNRFMLDWSSWTFCHNDDSWWWNNDQMRKCIEIYRNRENILWIPIWKK